MSVLVQIFKEGNDKNKAAKILLREIPMRTNREYTRKAREPSKQCKSEKEMKKRLGGSVVSCHIV